MTANEIGGAIFDLDGTLIDSYQAIYLGFHHAYTQMGLSPMPYEQVKRVVGLGLDHTFRELLGEERVPRALFLFRRKYEEVFRANTRLLPDAREVLETLHGRGIRLAVATNKLGRFSREIFEQFGMEKLFTVIVGDGDVPQNKPDPEMLRLAMEKMGVEKERAIFVGDSVIDIQTAQNAGVRVLAVPTGNTEREDLVKARPTVLLARFSDLLAHV
ncbi:MAG: HAD-IA family hydrolase [Deltaproteobacteria bacterium]|nr:HAD-IA family hydrolase [Deltaproteobacteria bacterium]